MLELVLFTLLAAFSGSTPEPTDILDLKSVQATKMMKDCVNEGKLVVLAFVKQGENVVGDKLCLTIPVSSSTDVPDTKPATSSPILPNALPAPAAK